MFGPHLLRPSLDLVKTETKTPKTNKRKKENVMGRKLLFAGLVAVSLVTWGAGASFAQVRPLPQYNPGRTPLGLQQYALQVVQVLPGSTAAWQGIEPGDVIVAVNNIPVRSLTDLNVLVAQSGRIASLSVIDGRTGGLDQVLVYPVAGRIGVICQQVPLGPINPIGPGVPPWNQPINPWNPGIQPLPLPGR
jgi:hypothetical protein